MAHVSSDDRATIRVLVSTPYWAGGLYESSVFVKDALIQAGYDAVLVDASKDDTLDAGEYDLLIVHLFRRNIRYARKNIFWNHSSHFTAARGISEFPHFDRIVCVSPADLRRFRIIFKDYSFVARATSILNPVTVAPSHDLTGKLRVAWCGWVHECSLIKGDDDIQWLMEDADVREAFEFDIIRKTTHEDALRRIKRATIFVSTSRTESFAKGVVEAVRLGLVPVVRNIPLFECFPFVFRNRWELKATLFMVKEFLTHTQTPNGPLQEQWVSLVDDLMFGDAH